MPEINLTPEQLEDLLAKSAERGARKAVILLLGIDEKDEHLPRDIRDLRDLLDGYRNLRSSAWRTLGRGLMIVLMLFVMWTAAHLNFSSFIGGFSP